MSVGPPSRHQAPRMLIATRFGIGVRDPAWFEHRLAVMSAVTAPSLLAQDDQEFEWGIFVGSDLDQKTCRTLERLIQPFEDRAFIDSNGHTPGNLVGLAQVRGLVGPDGNLLIGRIDDDDAWARTTVSAVRARVADWLTKDNAAPGLGLTYQDGLVWVMYDMLDLDQLQTKGDNNLRLASLRPYTCPWTSISEFVCTPLSLGVTPIAGSHSKVPDELSAAGFDIEVVSTAEPMWLYCRHKHADSAIERAARNDQLEIRVNSLSEVFGLDPVKTLDYIATAGKYGYSTTKRIFERRGQLRDAFKEAGARLKDPAIDAIEAESLRDKETRRRNEWVHLGHKLIAEPDAEVAPLQFSHVIQTRFSVRARWGYQEFPLEWLEDRLKLFDSYCLPSVASQTTDGFLWHVYCDTATEPAILEALQERAETVPQMRIALTGPNGRTPIEHVSDDIRFGDRAVLTTRLDSDDAIAKYYVEAIQVHAARFIQGGQPTLLLNFPRGYQLDAKTGQVRFDWMPRSSFHTLLERPNADIKTVLSGNHSKLHEQYHTEHDDSIPAWLMVIHGDNVLNKLREYYTGDAPSERLRDFGLDDRSGLALGGRRMKSDPR